MMVKLLSDLSGIKLFLNELDKGEAKARQSRIDAQNLEREQINREFKLGQAGLGVKKDPLTGEMSLFDIAPENNPVIQGQLGVRAASDPNYLMKGGNIILDPNGPKAQELGRKEETHNAGLALDQMSLELKKTELAHAVEDRPDQKKILKFHFGTSEIFSKISFLIKN